MERGGMYTLGFDIGSQGIVLQILGNIFMYERAYGVYTFLSAFLYGIDNGRRN